ncbi:hypothetical protein VTK26DRAFT_1214 [Humicola hyalothermophila]
MKPKFRQQILRPRGAWEESAAWMCQPYFGLEPYLGYLSTESPEDFSMETLLRARFSCTTDAMDMQQALCQLKGAPLGHCDDVPPHAQSLIQDCWRYSDERSAPARVFDEVASELMTRVSLALSTMYISAQDRTGLSHTRGWQERAIYAFALATAVFLPLSAVASSPS